MEDLYMFNEVTYTKLLSRVLLCLVCIATLSFPLIITAVSVNSAILTVELVDAMPGEDVVVSIFLESNPGIAGLLFSVEYDSSRLRVDGENAISRGPALSQLSFVGVNEDTYSQNPFYVVWFGTENDTSAGVVLNIEFSVLQDAPEGTAVVIATGGDRDVVNLNSDPVLLSTTQGGVNVQHDNRTEDASPAVTLVETSETCVYDEPGIQYENAELRESDVIDIQAYAIDAPINSAPPENQGYRSLPGIIIIIVFGASCGIVAILVRKRKCK